VYRTVPEEKTITETVSVPVQVQKEVQVRVCNMVPKTVTVALAYNNGCAGCGGY
jgi:hypothetical protein